MNSDSSTGNDGDHHTEAECAAAPTAAAMLPERERQAALLAYVDRIEALLKDGDLRAATPDSDVRREARARTVEVLPQLDGGRKGTVALFLSHHKLLRSAVRGEPPVVSLRGADLAGADLYRANLGGADLHGAQLSGANLTETRLWGAKLEGADLSGADMTGTHLGVLDLIPSLRLKFQGVIPKANPLGAILTGADLSDVRGLTQRQLYESASYRDVRNLPAGLEPDTREGSDRPTSPS